MRGIIEIRKATGTAELEKVFAIRRKVFVEEQNCPPELEWEHDDISTHFLATYNDSPAGAARWRKTKNGYKLERFAVLKEFRNYGIGRELVKAVLADLPPDARPVYLNAQITAIDFYLQLGFTKIGEQFEEAGIQHFKMIKPVV